MKLLEAAKEPPPLDSIGYGQFGPMQMSISQLDCIERISKLFPMIVGTRYYRNVHLISERHIQCILERGRVSDLLWHVYMQVCRVRVSDIHGYGLQSFII